MAAVVCDRQLAAREVKVLAVFIVCPGLLADFNGVDIIGAAIYLLLKLDWPFRNSMSFASTRAFSVIVCALCEAGSKPDTPT